MLQDARISNLTGHILLCSGREAFVFTLNGRPLLKQDLSFVNTEEFEDENDEVRDRDPITCCAFYETTSTAWMSDEVILTGHTRGVVRIWTLAISSDGKWHLSLLRELHHRIGHSTASNQQRRRSSGRHGAESPAITSVLPTDSKVFVGNEDGQVVSRARLFLCTSSEA